jgi:pimeloyl-ACP methyl ester carboxylesterase
MTMTADRLTVQVGPITTKYEKRGAGHPLLYLHGAFGYADWPEFLDILAESYEVYAPLHPGFEGDSNIDEINDLLDLTLYHADLIEALGLESPHVLGHYSGAMAAAEMAAINAANIGKLALAAPAGLWLDDNPGLDYNATPHTEMRQALFADPDSDTALALYPVPEDDEELGWQIIHRVQSLNAVGKFLWPIPDKGLVRRAHRIKCPTLVVVGDRDKIVPPEYADILTGLIPGSQGHVMPNAGHMFPHEHPGEFAQLVRDFLAAS